MSRLRCTWKNNCRGSAGKAGEACVGCRRGAGRVPAGRAGFALSFDAALAVVLFVGALAFMQLAPYPEPDAGTALAQDRQLAGDAIAALENTGFIAGKFDELGFSQDAADAIYAKFRSIAPELDANMAIKEYDYNLAACLETGKFGDCFPESDLFTVSTGNSVPEGSSLTRGSSVFVRKQGPSVCTKELLLADGGYFGKKTGRILFSEPETRKIFLDDENVDFDFDVNVTPSDAIECDEDVTVTLRARAESAGREPVDIIPVIDRAGTMSECAIVDGNLIQKLAGAIGGGTWQKIADVNVAGLRAFDALLTWTADCGTSCPEMYVQAPDGAMYGYYGGEPTSGCYVKAARNNRTIYILIPTELSQNGTWGIYSWNDNPAIDYNLETKFVQGKVSKMDAVKETITAFVRSPTWDSNVHKDQLGLVSYAKTAALDQALLIASDSNKGIIAAKINALNPGGATATGEGIYKATDELTSARANPAAIQVQIVLSDGKTNQGRDSVAAAADAYARGIIVYVVGFGPDANEAELRQTAAAGGGKYYAAFDVNKLKEVYDFIAIDIIGSAQAGVPNAKAYIPITEGMELVSPGSGSIDGNYLVFNIGDLNGTGEWSGSYTISYPCTENCDINSVTIPSEGAYATYDSQQVPWDANVTIIFKYRDLNVMIISGRVVGENDVYLDVRAANIGYLDSGATSVDFYLGDPDSGGELLGSMPVSALCPMNEPGCVNYYVLELRHLLKEGELYSVINRNGAISECPGNNTDWILCVGAPKTKYYSLQYTVWRRYE